MEILDALKDIELTETQVKALNEFFENWKTKTTALIEQKYNENVDPEKYILKADAEKAFMLFEEDCKAAFDLFESDADKAFSLFEEDAEKAFDLGIADVQQQYTENMAVALQEVYDEISDRVKKDFMESKEYKTIQQLKNLVLPLLEDTDHDLVEKIKSLNEETFQKDEEIKRLAKQNAITTLLKDIPAEYVETVEEFITAGKDEDEVIERFNTIVEMLETKLLSNKGESSEKRFTRKTKEEPKPITEENTSTKKQEKKSEDGTPVFRSILEEVDGKREINPVDEKTAAIIDKIFQ